MKQMSPFQIGIIAIAILLAVIGMYFFTTFKGFGTPEVPVGSVLIWGTMPQDAMDAGLMVLLETDDRFVDVAYAEKSAATFSQDLANAIASGQGPDMVIITQEQVVSESSKLAEIPYTVLPERTYRDSYLPFFDIFLTDTGTYGVPLVLDPLILYYNRAILSTHRVVNAPSTWEAVSALAPVVTQRDNRGTLSRSFIPLGEYANIRNARAILSLLIMQAGNSITVRSEGEVRARLGLDDESTFGTTAAESAVNFYAQFADPAKTVYSWNRAIPESRATFIAGDVALYPGFASELPFLEAANPNLDFDAASMPQPATASNRISYGVGYVFALPKASKNPSGALTTAFALGGVQASQVIASAVGMAPALRSLLVASPDDQFQSIVYNEALTARGWLSPAPYVTDVIFSAMMNNIISGRMDVEVALTTADQSLDAALR